jgi:hypothetical protein
MISIHETQKTNGPVIRSSLPWTRTDYCMIADSPTGKGGRKHRSAVFASECPGDRMVGGDAEALDDAWQAAVNKIDTPQGLRTAVPAALAGSRTPR